MAKLVEIFMKIFSLVLRVTRPLSDKVFDVLYWLFMKSKKPLPPIDDETLLFSATKLAEIIRKKQLSASRIMSSYISRIQKVEQIINAVTDQRFESAMVDALEVDRFLENTSKSEEEIAKDTPLLGVPFTCKESIGVAGMSMTNGLVFCKDRMAESDADTVALYKKAGAIPLTVTNVPVLSMWWESANHVFGRTNNPHNNKRTVGGSSGGEAALISSAGALIGIGTDMAGGIRIPSSFCGIYGHKPSKGVISIQTPWPGSQYDVGNLDQFRTTGPMCRYAEDLRLLTEVLAGKEITKLDWNKKVDFRKVKVYYVEDIGFPGSRLNTTADVKASVLKAAKHFEDEFGVTPRKLDLIDFTYGLYIWEHKLLAAGSRPFSKSLAEESGRQNINLLIEFIKSLFRRSDYTWPALYFAAVEQRAKIIFHFKCLGRYAILKENLEEIFSEDAILLMPTHPEPPPHYLMTIPKYLNIAYTCIFNVLGYPSTQVPAGLSNGLPIGIQVISSMYQDNLTIAAAVELDKVFKGWVMPCKIDV